MRQLTNDKRTTKCSFVTLDFAVIIWVSVCVSIYTETDPLLKTLTHTRCCCCYSGSGTALIPYWNPINIARFACFNYSNAEPCLMYVQRISWHFKWENGMCHNTEWKFHCILFNQSQNMFINVVTTRRKKRREKKLCGIFTGSFHFKSLMRFNKTQLDDNLNENGEVNCEINSGTFYSNLMQMLLI